MKHSVFAAVAISANTITPDPILVALPTLVTSPVKFAFVVTLPAVRLAAVPLQFVNTPAEGVPISGVVNDGEVPKTKAPEPVSSDIAVFNWSDVAVKVLLVKLIVLLVKVSVPANVDKVPVVGKVTLVAALEVNVIEFVAEVIRVEPVVKVKVPVPLVMVFPL